MEKDFHVYYSLDIEIGSASKVLNFDYEPHLFLTQWASDVHAVFTVSQHFPALPLISLSRPLTSFKNPAATEKICVQKRK